MASCSVHARAASCRGRARCELRALKFNLFFGVPKLRQGGQTRARFFLFLIFFGFFVGRDLRSLRFLRLVNFFFFSGCFRSLFSFFCVRFLQLRPFPRLFSSPHPPSLFLLQRVWQRRQRVLLPRIYELFLPPKLVSPFECALLL